jgi:hypothetical protein
MRVRVRAAATVAALVALAGLIGAAVFTAARDDATPASTTSTTTAPTTTTVSDEALADAIASSLQADLTVTITAAEARCIADVVVVVVELRRLERLVGDADPLASLTPTERDQLVRGVVDCVSPEQAAAILGSPTTTAPPVELPDEDL